jgi:hypothetical protein
MFDACHKFDFKLVLIETHKNWRPVDKWSCSDRTYVFDRLYMFHPRL